MYSRLHRVDEYIIADRFRLAHHVLFECCFSASLVCNRSLCLTVLINNREAFRKS